VLFEWDETKRDRVLRDRAFDFLRLPHDLFDGRPVLTGSSVRDDEERFVTIGPSEGRMFAVVWTRRSDAIRIITARRARHAEERQYRALYG
jgi:uncharacterized DUF497 family protein